MRENFSKYPYAFIGSILGVLSLLIVALIYIGAFDILIPLDEQGKGMFNFLAQKKPHEKNIIDYLNMSSIVLAIASITLSIFSRLKAEKKVISNVAMLSGTIPLILHFFLVAIVVALIIAVILNFENLFDFF